jgi:hypothetical protein
MESAPETIAEAQRLLEVFDEKGAARLLGQAVYMTSDPELLGQIHELARLGRANSKAGRLTRAMRWNGIVKSAEMRLEEAEERSSVGAAV